MQYYIEIFCIQIKLKILFQAQLMVKKMIMLMSTLSMACHLHGMTPSELVKKGVISSEEARRNAEDPKRFQ